MSAVYIHLNKPHRHVHYLYRPSLSGHHSLKLTVGIGCGVYQRVFSSVQTKHLSPVCQSVSLSAGRTLSPLRFYFFQNKIQFI